jgi:hypothetical protein
MSDEQVGVLEQERRRQQRWADLGLPDPIRLLSEERTTRRLYGPEGWRHPQRAALAEHFEVHPDMKPNGW